MHDEINELRKRLDRRAAKSSEATPSTTSSPFSLETQQASLPVSFCMPTMTAHEGKTDPQDHPDVFNNQMDLLQVLSQAQCICFVVTLTATTKKWFGQIKPKTVTSWTQFSGLFMLQFQGARKYVTPLSRLASIKQGSNETLKAYVRRFNKELATIHNPQENEVLMAAISIVRPKTPLWDKLQKDECKTLQEFYRRADKIMRLETAWEVIFAGRSVLTKAPLEDARAKKFTTAERMKTTRNEKVEIINGLQTCTKRRLRTRIKGS